MVRINRKSIFVAVLLAAFALYSFYIYKNIDLLIDSDMSSELVLSQILAREKTLLTDSWFYSTELRVFNTQYIFAPLFLLTDNYHFVRILGSLILDALLLISFVYACKALNIKYIPFLSVFILGCFTKDYFDFYIKAPHYIPYLLICFTTIGLVFDDKIAYSLKLLIIFLLSLISSMNGIRQLTAIYLPLFATTVLELLESAFMKRKLEITKPVYMASYIGFIGSAIGYLINSKILSAKYNIQADQWKLVLSIPGISKIKDIMYGWVSSFGYTSGISSIYSFFTMLISVLSLMILLIISIRIIVGRIFTKTDRFVLKFVIISLIEMTFVFLLTDMTVITRYFSLSALMSFFILGIYISRVDSLNICIKTASLLTIVFIAVNSFVITNNEIANSRNSSLVKIKDILLEENCFNGYASFWDANIITELSDGEVEVWMFRNTRENYPSDIYELADGNWLQKKSHYVQKPEGKTFVLINSDYASMFEKDFSGFEKYADENKKLLIFKDCSEMKEVLDR